MFNIDLGAAPAESIAVGMLVVAGIFLYFAPHMISYGYRKGQKDSLIKTIGEKLAEIEEDLTAIRGDVQQSRAELRRHRMEIFGIKQHLNIKEFDFEQTPNGSRKGK